jgi:large subunit ribosomal protein L6
MRGTIANWMLGELDLEVPEYVQVTQDPEAKMVSLNVQNTDAKDQKAMWGMLTVYNHA